MPSPSEGGEPLLLSLSMEFDGLDEQGRSAALNGHISSCPLPGDVRQDELELPAGRFVSLFDVDGAAMIAVGSTAELGQMLRPVALPASVEAMMGDDADARCRLVDLDGNGHLDLAISVNTAEGTALLVALADGSAEGVEISEPQLLLGGLGDAPWDLFRDDADELRLVVSDAQVDLDVEVESGPTITVTVSNTRPMGSDEYQVHDGDSSRTSSVVRRTNGFDLLRIDHSDRDPLAEGIAGADVGGHFLGSEQRVSTGGTWVAAHFSGGLVEGDGSSLLKMDDPRTIIGWLSTTGPFIPLPRSHAAFAAARPRPCSSTLSR